MHKKTVLDASPTTMRFTPYLFSLFVIISSALAGAGYIATLLTGSLLLIFSNKTISKHNAKANFFLFVLAYTAATSWLANSFSLAVFATECVKFTALMIACHIIHSMRESDADKILMIVTLYCIGTTVFILKDDRLTGLFLHANHLAYLCSLLVVYHLLHGGKFKHVYVLLLGMVIILTKSTGGMITYMAMLGLYFIKPKKNILATYLSVLILLPLVYFAFDASGGIELLKEKTDSLDLELIASKANYLSFGSEGSLVWRITYWTAIFSEFYNQNPMTVLFGEGLGTQSDGSYSYSFMIRDPHNDYLRVLVERGFVGFVAISALFFLCFRNVKNKIFCFGALLVPMLSGNIIVSLPFMLTYLTLIEKHEKNCNHHAA